MGLFGGLFGKKAAKKNQAAALELAKKAQWQPTNLNIGGSTVSWDGTNASVQADPTQQALANALVGAGSGFLGGVGGELPGISQSSLGFNSVQNPNINPVNMSGQLDPFLARQMMQANRSYQGVSSDPYNTMGLGGQLGEAASGFMGSLGSFDPSQLAAQYTDLLRQGALPGEKRAAQGALDSLFATGRLGTTGGSQMYEGLANAQNQADIQRQLAGMQFGGQEQNRIAGLAGNFAGMADQFAGANFGRNLNSAQFNNDRATQRFMNAMNLFGQSQNFNQAQANVGLQNNAQQLQQSAQTAQQQQTDAGMALQQQGMNMDAQQAMLQAALQQQGLFGQLGLGLTGQGLDYSQGLQQNLYNALGLSGNLSAARSGTQLAAWQPYYGATVARNNANAGFWGNLLDTGLKAWTGGNIWGP